MVTRQDLHALVDELPEQGLDHARRFLAALRDSGGDAGTAWDDLDREDKDARARADNALLQDGQETDERIDVANLMDVRCELGF